MHFNFQFEKTAVANARLGFLTTPHGTIETPMLFFCATRGSIKTLSSEQVKSCDTQAILTNTYHMIISPGVDTLAQQGGIHSFMHWDKPMMTDSGGYQIFSMDGNHSDEIKGKRKQPKSLEKITKDGAVFRSYFDGRKIKLTPENCIEAQNKIGADLILQLDQCTPYNAGEVEMKKAMERSIEWGDRSLNEFNKRNIKKQALYGIVQGGTFSHLRNKSAEYLHKRDFFGSGIGGSLGLNFEQMQNTVEYTVPRLPIARPIHLLGIGKVFDILKFVPLGIDTFDCVHPTRLARHGTAINPGGELNLYKSKFKYDMEPLDSTMENPLPYRRSYIHHLLKARETLALSLLTMHNILQMNRLFKDIRQSLKENTFYTKVVPFWLN